MSWIPEFAAGPVGMRFDGACGLSVGAGFFNFGFNFYSNGQGHYCSCDRGVPAGYGIRYLHRRPDMSYDGSCGGC